MAKKPQFSAWPDAAVDLETEEVIQLYNNKFAGAYPDPEQSEALDDQIKSEGGNPDGDAVLSQYGFAGDGAGKLILLFPAVTHYYGYEALTVPGQRTGDCVSMAGRDVSLHIVCIDALAGLPDERTGHVEEPPKVSEIARNNGVFINEGIYKSRGHNGQGMSCSGGARWMISEGGIVVRQKFPEADLESYNVQFETSGRAGTPDWLDNVAKLHPLYDMTRPKDETAARDFLDRGKPIWACAGLGWENKRDQYGYSRQKGSWAHSWHAVGYDDREETKKIYGFPLALLGHRWAKWNSGPRLIRGTNIEIPHGYWWADARLLRKCDMYALSGANGWKRATLPDFSPAFE